MTNPTSTAAEILARHGFDLDAHAFGEPPPFDPVEFRTEQAREVLARVVPPLFATAKPDHPKVAGWVRRYLADPGTCPSLMLAGPTGTGKTFQAWGAIRVIVESLAASGRGLIWRVSSHPELNSALRPKPDGSHNWILDAHMAAGLLLLDDIGAGKQTEWTGDALYRLVDHRWAHRKPTIYSTNLPPKVLATTVGDRVVSRLADAVQVPITGEDRRWTR